MNLDINDWKEFTFGRLICSIAKTKALNKDDLQIATNEKSGIRYITRTGENNGCEFLAELSSVDSCFIQEGNAITIGDTTATCFYQSEEFITGDHMVVIRADWLDEILALYVVTILNKEQYKYSYGRAFLIDRIKNTLIKLPIILNDDGTIYNDTSKKYSDDGYVPDWQWMENYIKSLHHKPLTTKNKTDDVLLFNVNEWQEFRFGNLISNINKSKALNKDDLIETNNKKHSIRYITRTGENNGCELLVDISTVDKTYIQDKNAISIGDTTATCFYQDEDFITGDHMVIVRAEWLNKPLGLYVTSILNKEQYKYSYGRAFLMDRIKDTIIKLPIVRNSDKLPVIDESKRYSEQGYLPDWQWMEKYMKSLPYGDRL